MKALILSLLLLFPLCSAQAQFGGFNLDPTKLIPTKVDPSTIDPSKVVQGGSKIVKGSTGVGGNEEAAIGGAVAVEIVAGNGGIWKNEAATRRVNLIGKTLALYSERADQTFRFGILDTSDINAFSAPGNYIFISRGAYEAASNDDELAGVLAHEIIHVTRRHALRIISRDEFISGMADVAGSTNSTFAAFDSGVDKVSATLLKHGYDSGTEFDADKRGSKLAASAGFGADGLLNFLKKIQDSGSSVFSTHPATKDRIAKLSQ